MKILVVSQYIPMQDRQADMLRLVELLRVASIRHSITLLATDVAGQQRTYTEECVSAHVVLLEQAGIHVCGEREAVAESADFEVVLFEYFRPALNRMERMRYRFPRAVMVIDSVDINYLRFASQERAGGDVDGFSLAVAAIRDAELQTYASADLVVAVSDDEGKRLRTDLPYTKIHVVPLIIDVPPLKARQPSSARLLFVGNYNHQANVDAARYMADEIFPIVRCAIPEAKLMIVGNRPPPDLVGDPSKSIEVTGFVPDLAPYYDRCDISIAPLTWGAGLKGKIAEAMAHGLPVVTTSIGASGFDLEHRRHAMVADTPAEFAAACIALHEDRDLYDRVRSEGRALVQARYSRDSVSNMVNDLFDRASRISPIRLSRPRRMKLAIDIAFHRHVGWRWERSGQHRLSVE